MNASRKIISTIMTFALIVGMLTVGAMLRPMEVKATDPTASEISTNSLSAGSGDRVSLVIPATLHVVNSTTEANGQTAYIPAFDAYIVAKPLTSGIYFPNDYVDSSASFPDSGKWISGKFAVSSDDSNTFGDDYTHSISSTDFGFYQSWFTSCDDGIYRYQIYLYDDSEHSFGTMFTLHDMTSANSMLFLDFYVNSGSVYAVVLVDDNNRKLVRSGAFSGTDYDWINSATQITAGVTIDYNVVDVTVSNKVIQPTSTSDRKSTFHYTAAIGDAETGGATNYDVTDGNTAYTTGTLSYTSSPMQFNIDEKYGDFTCTIMNYPAGQTLTVTQTSPQHKSGQLQVYTAEATQYSGDIDTASAWTSAVPDGYSTSETSPASKDITITVSSSNKAVSFVNVAVIELPPTGIRTSVVPFVVLIVLAGGLLTFFLKKKDKEENYE